MRICRKLIGANLKPIEVRIAQQKKAGPGDGEIACCAVKTGADVDEIVFSRGSGEYIVTADPYLDQLCVRWRKETLVRLGKKTITQSGECMCAVRTAKCISMVAAELV